MNGGQSGAPGENHVRIRLGDGESAVLVLDDPFGDRAVVAVPEAPPHDAAVLVNVRFGGAPRDPWANAFLEMYDVVAEEVVTPADVDAGEATVRAVDRADDMTGYGVALSQVVEEWSDDATLVVLLDSLTTLLQHVTAETAFRFVHVLSGRLAREEGVLVSRLNPAAHDEQTIAMVMQPFDVVVDATADELSVRRRP